MGTTLAVDDQKEIDSVMESRMDAFCELIQKHPDSLSEEEIDEKCPVTHYFADGVYARSVFIPKGMNIVGMDHKMSTLNVLLAGEIQVVTKDNGVKKLTAPDVFVSLPGKKIGFAETDCVFMNVHPNKTNTEDISKLKKQLIKEPKKNSRLLNWVKKWLAG